MMYSEFMELAGYNVTADDYNEIIEPMYNATPETIDKRTFVAMLNRKFFTERYVAYETERRLKKLTDTVLDYNVTLKYSTLDTIAILRDNLEMYTGKEVVIGVEDGGSLYVMFDGKRAPFKL